MTWLRPQNLLTGLFAAAIFLPLLLRLIPGAGPGVIASENRNPAPFPGNPLRESATYPARFDSWQLDSLPFRQYLVPSSRAFARLLIEGGSDGVIRGKDGFWFYAATNDGAPVEDFLGGNLFRRYELNRTVKALEECRAALAARNIDLLVVVPPNKISVYPELLPAARRYRRPSMNRAEQLGEALKQQAPQVKYIYLADALRAAKNTTPHPLYFKEDTHWNQLGAYIGIRAFQHRLNPGLALPDPTENRLEIASTNEFADLWKYRGGSGEAPFDRNIRVRLPWRAETFGEMIPGKFHRRGENASAPDPRRVWIYRDSFGTAMEPYLAALFRESRFFWKIRIGAQQFEKEQPDLVIIEVVERHLANLSEIKFNGERSSRLHLELFAGKN